MSLHVLRSLRISEQSWVWPIIINRHLVVSTTTLMYFPGNNFWPADGKALPWSDNRAGVSSQASRGKLIQKLLYSHQTAKLFSRYEPCRRIDPPRIRKTGRRTGAQIRGNPR